MSWWRSVVLRAFSKRGNKVISGRLLSFCGLMVLLSPFFYSAALGAASFVDQASFADQASVRELTEDQWVDLQSGTRAYTIDPYGYVSYWYFKDTGDLVAWDMDGSVRLLERLDTQEFEQMNLSYLRNDHALLLWDAGIGRVFHYDLATREMRRLDESHNFRSYFHHGDFVIEEDYTIFAFGGFGEFTFKDQLLYFNATNKEWLDIPYYGDRPDEQYYGDLVLDTKTQDFYYIQFYDINVKIYRVNQNNWRWNFLGDFTINNFPSHGGFVSGMRRYNPDLELIYLYGTYYYDINANEVRDYAIGNGDLPQIADFLMGAYNEETKNWAMMVHSKNKELSLDFIRYRLVDTDGDPRAYEIIVPESVAIVNQRNMGLMVIGLVSFSFLIAFVLRKGTASTRKKQDDTLNFDVNKDRVIVRIADRRVVFSDDLDRRFWSFVLELKERNMQTCELKEFDAQVLPSLSNESQYSVKRNKLIRHINSKLGIMFIELQKSELDRRYKRLVFHYGELWVK